jgi:hypothetical protein
LEQNGSQTQNRLLFKTILCSLHSTLGWKKRSMQLNRHILVKPGDSKHENRSNEANIIVFVTSSPFLLIKLATPEGGSSTHQQSMLEPLSPPYLRRGGILFWLQKQFREPD